MKMARPTVKTVERIDVTVRTVKLEDLEPEILNAIRSGERWCAICKSPITEENVAVVYIEDGWTWFICDNCPGTLRTTFLTEKGPSFVIVALDKRDAVKF